MKALANEAGSVKTAPPSKSVRIRQTCFEDYTRIAALQVRHGTVPRSREEWIRLWKGNPAYREGENQTPIGWVLETESGDIVGSVANFSFSYGFRGRVLSVAAAGDWFVDAPYRGYSLQLMARLMHQEHADVVLTTTASATAEAVYKVFGWSRAPAGTWNESAFWVANHRGFAKVALRATSVPFAGILSYPAAAVLRVRGWLAHPRLQAKALREVELCTEFDSRFDDFWSELKRQNEGVFLGARTREVLAWHFGHLTSGQTRWILTASNGSGIVAYAIFDRKDNTRGLSRIRLIDFQALKGCGDTLGSFLAWMLNECRRRGIHVLENTGCWLDRPDLSRIPIPYRRALPAWGFYYKADDRNLAEALQDPRVWVPSSFDGDVCL